MDFSAIFLYEVMGTAMLTLLGCGGEDEGPTDNACNYIVNQTYTSQDLMNCGAGRADCYWTITFHADFTYRWTYEDQIIERSFECSGLDIKVGSQTPGSFDPATSTLTWSGRPYK